VFVSQSEIIISCESKLISVVKCFRFIFCLRFCFLRNVCTLFNYSKDSICTCCSFVTQLASCSLRQSENVCGGVTSNSTTITQFNIGIPMYFAIERVGIFMYPGFVYIVWIIIIICRKGPFIS